MESKTDRFYRRWLQATFAYGALFTLLAAVNLAVLVLGLPQLYRHDWWPLANAFWFFIMSYQAYHSFIVQPPEIRRRWANMREVDAMVKQLEADRER